jgi:hypothetical protein
MFEIQMPGPGDKEFFINGPDGFRMEIDYDGDVDRPAQIENAIKVTRILNQHWND